MSVPGGAAAGATAIRDRLRDEPSMMLDGLARELDVPVLDVVECLPADECTLLPGSRFVEVMEELATWGQVTSIINTPEMVFEVKAAFEKGSMGRGWFNIPGTVGGHFKPEGFGRIALVSRALMGRPSRSIWFFNMRGDCLFKVYVGRETDGSLNKFQTGRFDKLTGETSRSG